MRLGIWIVKISFVMGWVQFPGALKSQPNSGNKSVFPPSNITENCWNSYKKLVKIPNLIHSALH